MALPCPNLLPLSFSPFALLCFSSPVLSQAVVLSRQLLVIFLGQQEPGLGDACKLCSKAKGPLKILWPNPVTCTSVTSPIQPNFEHLQ